MDTLGIHIFDKHISTIVAPLIVSSGEEAILNHLHVPINEWHAAATDATESRPPLSAYSRNPGTTPGRWLSGNK
jgi:hypothetical protein